MLMMRAAYLAPCIAECGADLSSSSKRKTERAIGGGQEVVVRRHHQWGRLPTTTPPSPPISLSHPPSSPLSCMTKMALTDLVQLNTVSVRRSILAWHTLNSDPPNALQICPSGTCSSLPACPFSHTLQQLQHPIGLSMAPKGFPLFY